MQLPLLSRSKRTGRPQALARSSMMEPLEPRLLLSVYYVSTSGNNNNDGLTPGTAWATPQHAADLVAAGDSVHVASGNYTGFALWTSGTASQRITFTGDPGATINARNASTPDGINLEGASYVTIEGFTMQGNGMPTTNPDATTNSNGTRAGIRAVLTQQAIIRNNSCDNWGVWGILMAQSDYPTIENNTLSRSVKEHGLYVADSTDYATVRNNVISGNTGNGIHLNPDISLFDGYNNNELIEKNRIYENGNSRTYIGQNGTQYTWAGGGAGINMSGVRYSTIQDNLLYDNYASGMTLYWGEGTGGSTYNTIVNNTVVMKPGLGRNVVLITGNSHDNTFFNNILYTDRTIKSAIDINNTDGSLTNFRSDYNVVCDRFGYNDGGTIMSLAQWQAATGQDTHSILSTPAALFADYANRNFNLSSASLARNAGAASFNGKNAPAYDFIGAARPQGSAFDIGAYEYAESGGNWNLRAGNDAYVDSAHSNTNYGSNTRLQAMYNTKWSYLKFDISALSGKTLTSATLKLYGRVSGTGTTNVTTYAYGVSNTTWSETTIKWSNKPALDANPITSTVVLNNTWQWYQWDVKAYVQAAINAGQTQVSICIKTNAAHTKYLEFYSDEATSNHPLLAAVA